MTNEMEITKDLINKWSKRANEHLEHKHNAELKTIQLRGILNIIMGKVESAISHDEYSAEVIRDISRVLDNNYDLINEE